MPTVNSESLCLRASNKALRVNRETGEIRDISLMTGDREAKGHGIYIDQRTLETGLSAIQEQGGRLRAAIKHPSLMDMLTGRTDRVLDFPGYFSEVEIRGNQLVAGRLDFFDSFKQEHPAEVRRLVELAEKAPDLFGVSVEIGGYLSFVDEEGNEFSEKPADAALKYDGMPAFRITDLPTASFVDRPAANDGLFAKFAQLVGNDNEARQLRKIIKSIVDWSSGHDADSEIDAAAAPSEPVSVTLGTDRSIVSANDLPPAPNGEMAVISTLRERITDKDRLTRALAHLAADATLSAEAIEARMADEDRTAEIGALRAAAATDAGTIDALRVEITSFKEQLATLTAELSEAKAAAVKWQSDYNTIRESGAPPVDLGAATGTPPASILDQYAAISDPDERLQFYRSNKSAIHAAKKLVK